MILTINEFKKKLDKPGKEDIDINNDGKVDKSDFYLLNKRRKINKAIKNKKNEKIGTYNIFIKIDEILSMFNTLSFLIDEGYITINLEIDNNTNLESINDILSQEFNALPMTQEQFDKMIANCKQIMSVQINENILTENTVEWNNWYNNSIIPAKELIKTNLEKTQDIVNKLDTDLVKKKHFTEDILYINGKLKDLVSTYPNL